MSESVSNINRGTHDHDATHLLNPEQSSKPQFPPEYQLYHAETLFQLRLMEQTIHHSSANIAHFQRVVRENDSKCRELCGGLDRNLAYDPGRTNSSECSLAVSVRHNALMSECGAANNELERKIHRETMIIGRCRERMNGLRGGVEPVWFADVSSELLVMVLMNLDYLQQQRLVRVCKRWKCALSMEMEHMYLDAGAHDTFPGKSSLTMEPQLYTAVQSLQWCLDRLSNVTRRLRGDPYGGGPSLKTRFPWKYHRPSVRQLTFNGRYVAQFPESVVKVLNLTEAVCPDLIQVWLLHIKIPTNSYTGVHGDLLGQRFPQLRWTLSYGFVTGFPPQLGSSLEMFRAHDRKDPILALQTRSFQLSDVVWGGADKFSQCYKAVLSSTGMGKPYPPLQSKWMAQWAPCPNSDLRLMKFMTKPFSGFGGLDNRVVCHQHRQFCQHLKESHYENMDGQFPNYTAYCLLKLNGPTVEPPPVPFPYLKLL